MACGDIEEIIQGSMELGWVESLPTQCQHNMIHPGHGHVSDTEQEIQDWVLEMEDYECLEEEWDKSNVRVIYGDVICLVAGWG